MHGAINEAFEDILFQVSECVEVLDAWVPYVSEEELERVLEEALFLRRRVREMALRHGFPVLLTEEGRAAWPQGAPRPSGC